MGEYDQGVVSAKTGPDRAQEKVTDLDERYFRMAEDYLNSELSLALDISKEKINEYIKERIVV